MEATYTKPIKTVPSGIITPWEKKKVLSQYNDANIVVLEGVVGSNPVVEEKSGGHGKGKFHTVKFYLIHRITKRGFGRNATPVIVTEVIPVVISGPEANKTYRSLRKGVFCYVSGTLSGFTKEFKNGFKYTSVYVKAKSVKYTDLADPEMLTLMTDGETPNYFEF